jgi:hypothetical protein
MNWGASLHHGWQGHIDMLIYVDIQWMEEILHHLSNDDKWCIILFMFHP